MGVAFVEVEDAVAILVSKGTYYQSKVFERLGFIFVKVGSGFLKLYANGGTSSTKYRLEDLDPGSLVLGRDSLGSLLAVSFGDPRELEVQKVPLRLEAPAEKEIKQLTSSRSRRAR